MTNNTVLATKRNKTKNWFRSLGPGLITAALVFGPSKMTITSKLGAEYGYALLWIIVVAIFFMIVFTSMAARIGLATNQSLLLSIRQKFGRPYAIGVGVGVFLVCTSFQAGNAIGVGIAIGEMTHTSPVPWNIVFTLLGIGLLFFRTFYNVLAKVMIWLIGVMLLAFITTLLMVKPQANEVITGLTPAIPTGSLILVIAFMASCVSIVGAFYQSYLVQERRRISKDLSQTNNGSVTGIIILGIMSAIVLICAATVLHPRGIKLASASDMSKALEPMFGSYASVIFLTGLFGAAFSSIIGNATVGGTLLGDALGYGSQLNSKRIKYLIATVMLIGTVIAIIFGKLPLNLIVFAQSITIFIVPFIGIVMYLIANDEKLMGAMKNSITTRLIAGLGLLMIIALALINGKDLFFKH